MKRLFIFLLLFISIFCLVVSCTTQTQSKSIESKKVEVLEEQINDPPIADAGDDIKCCTGEEITLDGKNSSDPEGDKLSYNWTIEEEDYTGETLTFKVNDPGTYYVTLTVSDGKASDSDMVQVNVEDKIEVVEKSSELATEEAVEEEETPINEWQAKCTRVIDGDTIELEDGSRVRYIGIDTPETDQNFGTEATEANRNLVEGKTITLVKDISNTDKYGRILVYVYVGDLFVNAQLVKDGYAVAYTVPPDVKYSNQFLDLQHQAQNEGKGLWGLEVIEEETSQEEQTQSYSTSVTSLTSPIRRGDYATISINTAPNTPCTITVYYKSGPSTAQGLEPKNSDGNGNCSWTWKVGTRTTPGDWKILINIQGIEQIEQYFTVTE